MEEEGDIQAMYDQLQTKRKRISLLEGCRSIEDFEHLNVIDEGTYGIVYRARDKLTGKIYAVKRIKIDP
jgi:cell division cycle 2-like